MVIGQTANRVDGPGASTGVTILPDGAPEDNAMATTPTTVPAQPSTCDRSDLPRHLRSFRAAHPYREVAARGARWRYIAAVAAVRAFLAEP